MSEKSTRPHVNASGSFLKRPVQDDSTQDHHAGFWRTLPHIET
jgi:hypothetical protein